MVSRAYPAGRWLCRLLSAGIIRNYNILLSCGNLMLFITVHRLKLLIYYSDPRYNISGDERICRAIFPVKIEKLWLWTAIRCLWFGRVLSTDILWLFAQFIHTCSCSLMKILTQIYLLGKISENPGFWNIVIYYRTPIGFHRN